MENDIGVQTRAMEKCREDEAHKQANDNTDRVQAANPTTSNRTGGQETCDPAVGNPTEDKTEDEKIEEFMRNDCSIGLDWYVPNLYNTQVREIIKQRLPIATGQGRILFNCTPLKKYFDTANFELDLRSGHAYTYSTPPMYIEIPCQRDEFDLELLVEKFKNGHNSDEPQMQELERVPLIRKIAAPADVMDWEEIQYHIRQYCKLWTLYADTSIQLKRASKLPQGEAVAACKIYGSHISDVLKQFDEITKLFAIENELKAIRCRELIPFPTISQG